NQPSIRGPVDQGEDDGTEQDQSSLRDEPAAHFIALPVPIRERIGRDSRHRRGPQDDRRSVRRADQYERRETAEGGADEVDAVDASQGVRAARQRQADDDARKEERDSQHNRQQRPDGERRRRERDDRRKRKLEQQRARSRHGEEQAEVRQITEQR